MPDYPIRVKVTVKLFTSAVAALVEEKDENDGGKGSNSASNRSSIAAASTRCGRRAWGWRATDIGCDVAVAATGHVCKGVAVVKADG
jgi:hypothetical protein